jgi:type I restriction enzyme, R subunit
MQSTNFEFLRPKWEDLADLGAIAEQYAHPDPQSAVAKLRTFAEQIVLFVYHQHGLPKPYQCNLNDLLTAATFVQAVPKVICSKLHSLRIHGNKGERSGNCANKPTSQVMSYSTPSFSGPFGAN